jgi:hypothetical protein
MPARRVILAAAILAAVLAPSARADGGPSPGVFQGGPGVADPKHGVRYVALNAARSRWTVLARINMRDGSVAAWGSLRGSYGVPMVTFKGDVGGLSPDGRMLIVGATSSGGHLLRSISRFEVVDVRTLRTRATIALRGDFSFDAVSPDGDTLYFIQHTSLKDFQRYRVRAYDLASARLRPDAIVDRTEPNMRGYPLDRVSSPGGAWVYTLYQGDEPFVHALDTVHAQAVCLDVPWRGSQNRLYRMHLALRNHGRRLAVVNPHGKVEVALNLRAAPGRTTGTTWAAAGLSGAGVAATALLLWRRRHRG